MCGRQEYSSNQAVAALLGVRAEFHTHNKTLVFLDAMVQYVAECNSSNNSESINSESIDHTSSSGPPIDDAHAQATIDSGSAQGGGGNFCADGDAIEELDSTVPDTIEPDADNESVCSDGSSVSFNSVCSSHSDSSLNSYTLPGDSEHVSEPVKTIPELLTCTLPELEEFGEFHCEGDLGYESDESQSPEADPGEWLKQLIAENRTALGSIKIDSIQENGKVLTSMQHEDYRYRPTEFENFSLMEFACTVQKVPKPSKATASTERKGPAGRLPARRFDFQPQHSLYSTHQCVLMAKQTIPDYVKRMPPHPGKRSSPTTDVWKWKARMHAIYSLLLFRPWNGPNGIPPAETLTWKQFTEWTYKLRTSGTLIFVLLIFRH